MALQNALPTVLTSPTPWWGTVLVAVLGIAGILIAQWLTNRRERQAASRDLAEKRRVERLEAYTAFSGVVGLLIEVVHRDDLSSDRLADILYKTAMVLGRIFLVGPEEVSRYAQDVQRRFETFRDAENQEASEHAYAEFNLAAEAMLEAMKAVIDDQPAPQTHIQQVTTTAAGR